MGHALICVESLESKTLRYITRPTTFSTGMA